MHLTRVHKVAIGGGLALILLAVAFFVVLPMMRPEPAKIDFGRFVPADWAKKGTLEQVHVTTPADGATPAIAKLELMTGAAASLPKADAVPAFAGQPYYGTYTSEVIKAKGPFNWAVASWNADTPLGTWVQIDVRATVGGRQTKWYTMGVWASGSDAILRQSVENQNDADGMVATDTLMLKGDGATAYQYRLTLYTTDPAVTPDIRSFSIVACNRNVKDQTIEPDKTAWGTELAVPERSQQDYTGGSGWCSPTSTSMVMEYWANETGRTEWNQTVPDVAAACFDNVYGGTGNWPFNTAGAASFGLDAFVTRFESFTQVEQWIKAGVPVVIGIHFSQNQLDGAPISSTVGHLICVRGFDAQGNVICNDPAATTSDGQKIRVVYDRTQLARAWLGANGVAYIIYPEGHEIPGNSYGAWVEPPTK